MVYPVWWYPDKKTQTTITTERNKMSAVKKSETCGEQLRRMCKNIADSITNPKEITAKEDHGKLVKRTETASDWMEGTYDIRYTVDSRKEYMGAEIMVAGGGPTIWVDTWDRDVKGYWGCDKVREPFIDNIGLDDYCEDMYGC
jgi:hypothetical protein